MASHSLRTGVFANYAGQAWIAVMGIAFVPVYIRTLGIEGFGLVGFMLGLQSLSVLLDFGMGVFLSREIARRMHDAQTRGHVRRLVRTLEWLAWPIALLIAAAIWLASDAITLYWLHPSELDRSQTTILVTMVGACVAMLWPTSFYSSALTGLEQQPRQNLLAVFFATLRYMGVLPVMYFTDTGLYGFFGWFALVAAAQSLCTARVVWSLLPPAAQPPRFDLAELRSARSPAFRIFAITALALALTQVDRLAVSALRPLAELGYYSAALTVTAGLGRMMQPMFNAIFPRFSRLVAQDDQATLTELYHLSSQSLAVIALSAATVLGFYAHDLLLLWTGDRTLADTAAVPLMLLVAGTAANGLLTIPYALQLANGMTRLALLCNAAGLAIGAPLCVLATMRGGLTGAAMLWLTVNLAFVIIVVPVMHRSLLRGQSADWFKVDVLPPLAAAVATVLLAKRIVPSLSGDAHGLFALAAIAVCALLMATLAAGRVRTLVLASVRKLASGG